MNGPDDITTKESLNQKQIEQLESVLEQKRAFFFNNWIFEYNQNTLKEILKNEEEELTTEGKVFGKPEKKLIKSLLAEIEGRFSFHPTQWKSAPSLYDYEPCRSGKILRELAYQITKWNPD